MASTSISTLWYRLYTWAKSLADKSWAIWALAAVAFFESLFFPVPPDILLIPLVLGAADVARRKTLAWWVYPAVCLLFSLLGGLVGYGIGVVLMDQVGWPIIEFFNYQHRFEQLTALYDENSVLVVLAAGLTPIPYKVFTLTSGAMGMNLFAFIAASAVSRGIRFFALAWLLTWLGPRFEQLPKHLFTVLCLGILVLLIAAYSVYKSV